MKKVILFGVLIGFGWMLYAQENNESDTTDVKNWSFSGFFQQNTNQVSFTNWAAGGENSFSLVSQVRLDANYKHDDIQWENYLDLAYGIIKTENTSLRKNTDKIDIFTKVGRNLNDKISASALMNFQSQFAEGFNFPNDSVVVSRFMAPGYLTGSVGLDYKPVEFLSIYLSPATGKFTFVTDQDLADQGRFGVKPAEFSEEGEKIADGQMINPEFGAMLRIAFNKEILTNVVLNTRVTLFNNYTDSDISNRKNTDVDWILDLNMPVNEFITVSVGFHLIYDHDIKIPKMGTNEMGEEVALYSRPTTQFKQQFGIGLVYKF